MVKLTMFPCPATKVANSEVKAAESSFIVQNRRVLQGIKVAKLSEWDTFLGHAPYIYSQNKLCAYTDDVSYGSQYSDSEIEAKLTEICLPRPCQGVQEACCKPCRASAYQEKC